jgi:hypothetical protein
MAIDWDAKPRRAGGIEMREVTDGFVAYDPKRDRLHFLNPTATMLLEICDGNLRADELPQLLASAFGLRELPRVEVAQCLERLLEEGLIIESEDPRAK